MTRYRIGAFAAAWLALAAGAQAQLLDDIDISPVGNEARVQLHFSEPVRYVRHFPPASGQIVHITLQAMGMSEPNAQPREHYKHSPKSDLVPPFTVRYSNLRDCAVLRDPICLVIEFGQPVDYQVQMSVDSRSLLLFVARPANKEKSGTGTTPAPR